MSQKATHRGNFAVRFIQSATGQGLLLGLFLGPAGVLGVLLFSSPPERRSRTAAAVLGFVVFVAVAVTFVVLAISWASQFE